MGDWCLIESDPGVFTELVTKIGCKGVLFDEIWDMDSQLSASDSSDIYGLVFLFKCNDLPADEKERGNARIPISGTVPGMFFAKQVIQNACATQAILSVLLNSDGLNKAPAGGASSRLGKELTDFKSFTTSLDAEMRGLALSNQEVIKKVHNSFARQSSFSFEKDSSMDSEDSFHFVAYIPYNGKVYELDGLREGPMEVGKVEEGKTWLDVAKPEIQERMQRYQSYSEKSEIRFNLLSVQSDPAYAIEEEMLKLRFLKQRIAIKLVSLDYEGDDNGDLDLDDDLDDDDAPPGVRSIDELPDDLEELKKELKATKDKISSSEDKLKTDPNLGYEKKKKWEVENGRRRHDYVPFLLCCLKKLAEQGALMPAYNEAKELAKAEKEKEEAEGKGKETAAAA